jgi:5-methylcytosine-specific restriction endonuclease McrA
MRVFEAYHGLCGCCGTPIAGKSFAIDHVLAIANGGKNEESNLQPILAGCHKTKTRADVATKAKTARIKARHLGLSARRSSAMPGSRASKWKRKINGQVVLRNE